MIHYQYGIPSIVITIVGASGICIGNAYDVLPIEIVGYAVMGVGAIGIAYAGYLCCALRPTNYTNTVETNPVQSSMKRNKSDTDLKLIPGDV
jgi:hypothetical protein